MNRKKFKNISEYEFTRSIGFLSSEPILLIFIYLQINKKCNISVENNFFYKGY